MFHVGWGGEFEGEWSGEGKAWRDGGSGGTFDVKRRWRMR